MTSTGLRAPARVPRPAVRTGQAFLLLQLRLGAWLWAIVAVVAVGLALVLPPGSTGPGVWQRVDQGPRWFLFAMAIVLVTGYLPAHVANGMTRRSFSAALVAVMAVTSVAYAALWTLGFAIERAVLSAGGSADLASGQPAAGGLPGLGLEGLALFATYAASGMLVGAAYYRAGAGWGTLTLPLTVGPVLLAEALVSRDGVAELLPGGSADRPGPLALLALVVLAPALAAAAHGLLRSAPIRTRVG